MQDFQRAKRPQHLPALARICINGGRRGYLVGIAPRVLVELLAARPVACALSA